MALLDITRKGSEGGSEGGKRRKGRGKDGKREKQKRRRRVGVEGRETGEGGWMGGGEINCSTVLGSLGCRGALWEEVTAPQYISLYRTLL